MNRLPLLLMLAALTMTAGGSQDPSAPAAPGAEAGAAARAAMEQADRDFCRAVADRNVERFKALIAADAVFHGSGGALQGPEAIARAWAPLMAPDRKVTLTWDRKRSEVSASGDLGYTEGAYERTSTDAAGTVVKADGTYVTIWRRHADGSWRAVLDIGAPRSPGR